MKKVVSINQNLVSFGIPLSLFGILIFLIKSSFFDANIHFLDLAITADLVLVVPLVYFLLIRKTDIPKTTIVPMMIVGLVIGSYLLPIENQNYLKLFKNWALPVVELSIVTFVIIKMRRAVIAYKSFKTSSPDFYTTLKNTYSEILPKKVVIPFATEIAVVYYGFINWKTVKPKANEFSYHKESGTPVLLGAFIFIILIETFVVHILLENWNMIIAWIFTGLSIYTVIQIFGFAKSLTKRPISIENDYLYLKYGILNEVKIPYSTIKSIYLSKKDLEKNKLTTKLSPFGELESHNTVIELEKESTLIGIYGFKKKFKVLGLHLDKPNDFIEKIENKLAKT